MGKFYDDLRESFEDILAYRKGKITLRSEFIELPELPLEYISVLEKKSCISFLSCFRGFPPKISIVLGGFNAEGWRRK